MRSPHALDGIPAPLWRLVALARHRLLMLDYDGTLAPFKAARADARPLPHVVEALHRIGAGRHTTVAIVSGRPVREVEQLVGTIPAVFVGEHGWECRAPDGSLVQRPLGHSVAATIEEGVRIARLAGWADLLERKRTGVVLHTRSLPEEQARTLQERCIAAWGILAREGHVTVDHIDGGIELRARGHDKGTVVQSLLSKAAPGTLGVFVGDDVTDEDAFDSIRDWGFGVRVGDSETASFAMARVPSCEAVGWFLEEWLAVVEAAEGQPP